MIHQKRFSLPPKAVIFDIGRVIVNVSPARALAPLGDLLRAHAGNGTAAKLSPDQVWAAIERDPSWAQWQEGRLTLARWHEHTTQMLGLPIPLADFRAAWNRALDPKTILDDNFFSRLNARCRLALLSNTDPIHAAYIESDFAFVRYFPVRIYSCNVGLRKPDPAIYRAALSGLRVSAGDAIYIDDVVEFVEAASQLGLDAIHFKSAAELTDELSKRGLLVE